MKTIAIHSHKGGVGKTTVSLLLAKYAQGERENVCLVDFDFIGSGMSELLPLETRPVRYLEEFFLKSNPDEMELDDLMVRYSDRDTEPQGFNLILNIGVKWGKGKNAEKIIALKSDMMGLVRNEVHFREIGDGTKTLLKKLDSAGFTLVILDCHPGLGFVSETIRPLTDLNVYVTTPNRSDCFSLLKIINMQKLDGPSTFLVFNRAEEPVIDLNTFKQCLCGDPLVGTDAESLFPQLKVIGREEDHFACVPHSDDLKLIFYIQETGYLPRIEDTKPEFSFCKKTLSLIKALQKEQG